MSALQDRNAARRALRVAAEASHYDAQQAGLIAIAAAITALAATIAEQGRRYA